MSRDDFSIEEEMAAEGMPAPDIDNRTLKADAHAASGGDRAAFLDGWDTMARAGKLFAGMRRYQGDARTSFVAGFHACDDHLTVAW